MRYSKPNIVISDRSLSLVQSGDKSKPGTFCRDAGGGTYTIGAYEVDE